MKNKRILVISDMHIPYHHKDSIKFLKEIKKEFKPDRIVNIGDSSIFTIYLCTTLTQTYLVLEMNLI
jgi:predicted phosphodiesterase